MTAHEELGTRNNPIDVDCLLDPSPSPPCIPIYTPLLEQGQHWLLLLVLYADDMVTHRLNAFGMAPEFVRIAKK